MLPTCLCPLCSWPSPVAPASQTDPAFQNPILCLVIKTTDGKFQGQGTQLALGPRQALVSRAGTAELEEPHLGTWNCDFVLAWKLIPTIQGFRPPVPSSLSAWCEESSSRSGTLIPERSGVRAADATQRNRRVCAMVGRGGRWAGDDTALG